MKKTLIGKFLAELLGSFTLVLFVCGAAAINSYPLPFIAAVFAATVMVMVYAFGSISGAHLNPGITFGFVVAKQLHLSSALFYWLGQVIGAALAIIVLKTLPITGGFAISLPAITPLQALFLDTVLAFLLMFVFYSVSTDVKTIKPIAAPAIGLMVGLGVIVTGSFLGVSMNPVRSLAAAIGEGNFQSLWIYWVSSLIGSTIAVLFYDFLKQNFYKAD